jgi:hypothetical protein
LYHRIPSASKPVLAEESLAILNRYAVETRYPGDWDIISRREAEDALGIAQAVREVAARQLATAMQ